MRVAALVRVDGAGKNPRFHLLFRRKSSEAEHERLSRLLLTSRGNIDRGREVLLTCPEGVKHVCREPSPQVRFRNFGDSGLGFELLAWLEEAKERGKVIDALNSRVYKAFAAAGIEIPYSKHDVFIKQMPGS